jgi:hypothetical protein
MGVQLSTRCPLVRLEWHSDMAISFACVSARKISAVGSPTYYGQWPAISGPETLAKIARH